MTTKKARDFLDKELFVNRSIVTFRSLSRELRIHVNDAKKELQFYYDAVRDTDASAVPTYLVSGEVPALTVSPLTETQQSDYGMDMDMVSEEDREEPDVLYQSKVLLVDMHVLEEAKLEFSRVHSVHIYSLSPSRLGDAGLVCTPSYKVHRADAKGGPEFFSVVGKITGSHVKFRAGAVNYSAASSSKTTLDVSARVQPKSVAFTKTEPQTTKGKAPSSDTKEQVSTTTPLQRTASKDKPKPSGKLDWSKAKTKDKEPVAERIREEKKPKVEPDSSDTTKSASANKKPGLDSKKVFKSEASGFMSMSGNAQKRGTKRKPVLVADLESESESESSSMKVKPNATGGPSVTKEVVSSDEDDDGEVRMLGQRRPRRKSAMTSDSEVSLRAMMDIDDEQVERISRVSRVLPQREEEEESEENEPEKEATAPPITTEDEESDHVPVVPKRKPRKVVPVGRNGLKKRRVIKSRTMTDAKGYMQTEDYSSYESVEEEEEDEEETKPKGKGKAKETKKTSKSIEKDERTKSKGAAKEEGTGKPKAKPLGKSRGGAPKRGGLLNFFGPEKGKK